MTSPTEFQLLALHRAAAVRLSEISENYLGMTPVVAQRNAALNTLPFPTFRMSDSNKAPYMVKISDLAKHIDSQHKNAAEQWEVSQV